MSRIMRIGLRLVRTTRYIPNNNTTKYLQSMCHVRNGSSHAIKNSITSAQKEWTGFWKKISAVAKKTLKYSTIPLTVIAVGCTYLVIKNPSFWEEIDMITTVYLENLKYSIIPSTIITSSVLFNDGEITIKTREDNIHLINDNTRNLMGSKELNANILDPFPRGEPIPMKIGKFNGLLDKGKLILQTEDGDTTFIIHHTLGLEVKKSSETLQNEIAANKKIGKFNYSFPGSEMTYAARTTEEKWTVPYHTPLREIADFRKIFQS